MSLVSGDLDRAARIQQRLIQKFPDDYMLRNHLATVFMTYGQNAAAKEVLQEVRGAGVVIWWGWGYSLVGCGFFEGCGVAQQGGGGVVARTIVTKE